MKPLLIAACAALFAAAGTAGAQTDPGAPKG